MGDLIEPELMSSGFFLQMKVVWWAYERLIGVRNTSTRVTSDVRRYEFVDSDWRFVSAFFEAA